MTHKHTAVPFTAINTYVEFVTSKNSTVPGT